MKCLVGHIFSRAMNQPYPRKCVQCGEPEVVHIQHEIEPKYFKAWVAIDSNNKPICYMDESLGMQLELLKHEHERKGYQIIELVGEIK